MAFETSLVGGSERRNFLEEGVFYNYGKSGEDMYLCNFNGK